MKKDSFKQKKDSLNQNEEQKQAVELLIANKELAFQNEEKEKRAAELLIANKELAFQNEEKEKRAAELLIANKELAFQNEEKEKRAAELLIANKELAFQNAEKEKRAAELLIANKELTFQNEEKEKRAAELLIANKELIFQNEEKIRKAMQTNALKEHNLELKMQKKLLTEASEHKSSFLSNMSHEIRTPLNAIVGFTDLTLKTKLTPQQSNYLNKIKVSSSILLGIIGDILDISKLEADKVKLETSHFKVEEILANVTNQISTLCQEKGLELIISIAEDVPISLIGDSLRLGQVLTNLTGNAVKFTDVGEISIKVKLLKKDRTNALLQFSVSDTGIGLTKEQIDNLFQPFYQVETSTTRMYGGTGLGLAISRKLVSLMDGDIWVESDKDKGSTFFFTGRFKIKGEKRFSDYKNIFDKWDMKVLVVDDSLESKESIRDILTSISFNVTTCSSGQKAVNIIKKAIDTTQYDLVIMDWEMPDMDGIEAARRIKQLNFLENSPAIIMLTTYDNPQMQAEIKKIGLDALILKPVTPSLLLNSIMQVFGKKGFELSSTILSDSFKTDYEDQLQGIKVLLVEDNEINQEVAQEILQGVGMVVTIANNGKVATEMISNNKYDIVLMDVHMPVMNGYDATRVIRSDPSFKDLPIIAITANALKGEKEKCIQAGMNDYIAKPIDIALLYQMIQHWLTFDHKAKQNDESTSEISKLLSISEDLIEKDITMMKLEGIDIKSAVDRLGGNQKLYRKLLIKFHKNHQDDMKMIRLALDKGNLELAKSIIHTLKGTAGNIGANKVYAATTAFEDLSEDAQLNDIEPLLKKLERAIEQVFASIMLLSKDSENVINIETEQVDIGQLKHSLQSLTKLLNDNDLDASEFLEDIISKYDKTSFSNKLTQIKELVEQYDYDKSLVLVNKELQAIKERENGRKSK